MQTRKPRVIATIQARMGASRLPGKVLRKLADKPAILWQVERLKSARLVDEVIVATSANPLDDVIADFCKEHAIPVHRGSENDVLSRVVGAIRSHGDCIHVPCCGDSPFIDPALVDEAVAVFLKYEGQVDCVTNALKTTYPPGQEVFALRSSALIEADQNIPATEPLREHVMVHITSQPEKYKILSLDAPLHYRFPEIYLELDTEEDYRFLSRIADHFHHEGTSFFSLAQILDYLRENPHIPDENKTVERRWRQFRYDK